VEIKEFQRETSSVSSFVVVSLVVSRSNNMSKQQNNISNPLDDDINDESTINE
jgi:hypothetical protein